MARWYKLNLSRRFIIMFVLVSALLAGSFFLWPSVRFIKGKQVLEKGVIYRADDFILRSNGIVTAERNTLYTNEVGIQSIHYKVKKGLFTRDVVYSYEVVDTTPPVITIRQSSITKEAGESLTPEEMEANVRINEGTFECQTDYDPVMSGSYTVDITAEDDYGNISYASYEVVVIDSEDPIVFRSGNVKVLKGSDFDIRDYISYGDNADPEPQLQIEGKVNTSRLGRYQLHLTVTDRSGNRTSWHPVVEVVSKLPEPEYDDYSYSFESFKEEYQGEGRKLGIDVSEWQDEVDYEAVKEAGCEFVIMRVGFSHKGKLTVDKQFHRNLEEAKKAGLPVGIYVFTYDNTEEYLLSTLDQVFEELGDAQLELPIVFDWENFDHFQEYELSFKDLEHLYEVFEKTVNEHGYQSMLYGSKYYLQTVWTHAEDHPIWLAQYADWPSYTGPYQIWQVLDYGEIDGIDWYADFDIWFIE